ncbi:excalibur calcium-binding domain-containing protein [Roseomonas marmotae]|uniref:excalibur calcium-binding domain-containing protein n=1 Tax=Roseomonas marmotae TaxID=2768161 RepID=UPI003013338B
MSGVAGAGAAARGAEGGHAGQQARQYCGEMRDCAEARFYLQQCGLRRLDGDGDGVPCERLCR